MRSDGADFLEKNAALAEEVRRTLVDLDEVEKELKRAAKCVETATGLTIRYRTRLQALCDATGSLKKSPERHQVSGSTKVAGA
jgi:hypothetical protein